MKRLNKLLILLIMFVGFLPFVVKAAPANVTSWKLKCDKQNDIMPNETVKCHLLGIVTNATGTDPNVKYLITRVSGKAIEIVGAGSNTNLKYFHTDSDEAYGSSNTVPRSSGEKCPMEAISCYDWYKQNDVITRDVSSSMSTGQFATSNDFAYFELKLLPDHIVSDIDCARLCVYAETMYEGSSTPNGEQTNPTVANGGCIELHLGTQQTCSYDGTNYYDSQGNKVNREAYVKDCLACRKVGSKYYDLSGNEVADEAAMKKACGCRVDGSNYYDKDNNKVNKEQYLKSCACRYDGTNYYDDNNNKVTKEQYQKACNPHCKCDTNGQCYDNNGTPITKEDYNKICNPHCYCDTNGQCYDDNGKPVTDEEYKKACACRIEDGKYYDDTGAEVDEETFRKKCNPHCYCNKEGKCYDSKGKEVTTEQYKKSCGCRIVNGKYYDKENKEVDKETYEKVCNPKTGTFVPYVSIVVLLLGSYGIFNLIKYYKHNKKIYKV